MKIMRVGATMISLRFSAIKMDRFVRPDAFAWPHIGLIGLGSIELEEMKKKKIHRNGDEFSLLNGGNADD
jgi:hypothetical protein